MLLTTEKADRVVLNDITWEQFESLLPTLGDKRTARLAYDKGSLEIMTPLPSRARTT